MPGAFETVLGEIEDRELVARAAVSQARNPEQAGKANTLARRQNLPAEVVERNLPEVESRDRFDRNKKILDRYPVISSWSVNPRNAAVAVDDYETLGRVGKLIEARRADFNKADNIFESSGDYLSRRTSGLASGFERFTVATEKFFDSLTPQAQKFPGSAARVQSIVKEYSARAAANEGIQRLPVAGEVPWETVKARPSARNIGKFIAQQGVASIPDMALALSAPYLYVAGRSGEIGQERAKNNASGDAAMSDILKAAPAAALSAYMERLGIEGIFFPGATNAITRIGKAAAIEGATEFVQEGIEYAGGTLGTKAGFDPLVALDQSLAGAVGGAGLGGGVRAAIEAPPAAYRGAAKGLSRVASYYKAKGDAALIDQIGSLAIASKTQTRDPDAFASLIEGLGQSANVYIPAEKVREYLQSDDFSNNEFWDNYADQIDEVSGGDVVIPLSAASAYLPGTPAWEALKGDIRLSPGGESLNEVEAFNESVGQEFERAADQVSVELEAENKIAAPRQKLFESARDKLQNAGERPDVARQQAELIANRYATRAARLGKELTGGEFDSVDVRQILPEGLAPIGKVDNLTIATNIMRGGYSDTKSQSLVKFVRSLGGIDDVGGDVESMGFSTIKGIAGKGSKKLIRKTRAEILEASGATPMGADDRANTNSPDYIAQRAWEAGFFPDFGDRPSVDDLLQALGNDLQIPIESGATKSGRRSADALRQLLTESGLDPDSASDAEIREAVGKYKQSQEGRGYEQEARGRAVFTENRTIIELFKDRNLSTVIHELGHVWLEELQVDAALPDAPDSLKADWQTVVDWFKANGYNVTEGVIPVEAHELWARGIERYAMEGKAPSTGLRKAFTAFKSWMLSIYQVVNNLRSPITPEVREVMDRLIATDEEIIEARNEQNIITAFDTLEAAQAFGMNEAAYKDYVNLASEARDESFDALLFKTMAAIRRRVTQEYKDARAAIIDDARARVDAQPVFKALSLIKQGQRIDKDWLVEAYGIDALQQLPAGVPHVYIQNGTDPDLLAELSGFQTGDEMVKAFIGIESRRLELQEGGDQRSVRQYVIDQEADALMNERFGDPLNDGSIEDEALAAVHSDKQGEVISAELRALGRKSGKTPTPYRIARIWAAEKVSRGIVSDVTSRAAIQRYARAASKASAAAQEAIASRNNDEAFRQKQIQMINNALVSEAKQASDNIDAAVERLSGYVERRTIKTMDQDYLERIHDLLERVDLKQRSQASEARKGSFSEWAKEQDELGYDVVVPNEFAETLGKTNWSKLFVEALISLDETVKQIAHMGRQKQKLLDAKEERDFDEVVREVLEALKNLLPLKSSDFMDAPFAERMKAGVASIDAVLLKIETLIDWLDGGNSNGVFNRVVFKPISDAQHNAATMMEEFGGKIAGLMNAIPKETIKRWSKRVSLPELINVDTGNPWIMDRSALISMALNMGNEGNIQRLTDGYSWNEANVREVLNRELTQEEWQFVQSVWDTINELWLDLSAMERRVNGVAPEKVESVPFETPFGIFKGGYFPAVYDSSKSQRANELDSEKMFSPSYTRATTRSSATKERAQKVERPILLQLGVINRHMREVIHDITHREAVMQANKFLSSKRVSGAIIEVLGPERYRQFEPWLKYVANQWAHERAGNEGLSKWLGKARANTTFVGMGFRASTMLMQIAGLTQSAKVIGPKWVVNGAVAFSKNPIKVGKFAIEKSGELQARLDGMDRDIRSRLLELEGKNAAIDNARRFAFKGIGYMDRMVSIPTWLGAYNKALSEGFDDQQAIYAGDKAIRQSQGSGAAKDLAAVQRGTGKGGEALKLLTMFYSFQSANYQLHRTLGRDVLGKDKRKERDISSLAAQAFFLVILGGILPDLIIGRGPEEDEDWGLWAFQKMLSNSLGPIPIVRDVVPTVANKLADKPVFGYRFTPAQGLQESIIRVAGDVDNLLEGGETTRATRNALELAGYTTGLVPGQLAASTQFLVDLGEGEYEPDGFGDWYEGITTGKIKEE